MVIGEALSGLRHRWATREESFEVDDVTHDSRRTGPGVVFVAIRGGKADGLSFVPEAIARGAAGIVVGAGRSSASELHAARRVIEVDDERVALAILARNLNGRVDERLPVVGVTGTNGKTSTCRIAAEALEAGGRRTGILGTLGHRVGDEAIEAERTTPEAPEIHRYLARMLAGGCTACVMEVSSHALDLKRVHGIGYAVTVFTNLTRDHLDYHGDMEAYFEVKASLFRMSRAVAGLGPAAVVNIDDPYGARLASGLERRRGETGLRLISYGRDSSAMMRMTSIDTDESGCRLVLQTPEGGVSLESQWPGSTGAYNVTAGALTARALGVEWGAIAAGVAKRITLPGRFERIVAEPGTRARQEFSVIVDYAHTDDALRTLLENVREITSGRVIVVFGCGGDRDRTKRPLMGSHAARLADVVFVTSDNPRGESPEGIIEEIMKGIRGVSRPERIHVEPDRGKAIEAAIGSARKADTVVIAGKGHETCQIIGDRVTPFDDRLVARRALGRVLGGKDTGGGNN